MSVNGFPQSGAGIAPSFVPEQPMSRAARATQSARQFREDESMRNLEACRVFVSAFFREFTNSKTSVPWIEPFLLTPIIRVDHEGDPSNENGVVVTRDSPYAVRKGREYKVLPGHMVDVLAPDAGLIVNVAALKGVGTDWGTFDVVDDLNDLLFPEHLLPLTGPNWLDPYDPMHQDLYANMERHLVGIRDGASRDTLEYQVAAAAITALARTRQQIREVFHELARQSKPNDPVEFGPTETMWCLQMGMEIPAWAVEWDRTRTDVPKEPTKAEQLLERFIEVTTAQAETAAAERASAPPHPDLVARMTAIEEDTKKVWGENADLKKQIADLKKKQAGNTPPTS